MDPRKDILAQRSPTLYPTPSRNSKTDVCKPVLIFPKSVEKWESALSKVAQVL